MGRVNAEAVPTSSRSDRWARTRRKWAAEPSERELLILVAVTCVSFVSTMALFHSFFAKVEGSGDNPAYLGIALAIRHWNFQGLSVKAFWGLPYVMAGISVLTGISDRAALLLVSYCACFASIVLAFRLWDGWIAGFFAILNFDWMQRSFLGGSESLSVALLLGAFFAARRKHWILAALLASFSTTVRPLGMLALVGLGLALLWKRDFRNFSLATLTGLVVGGLYVLPLALYFKNPLANAQAYQRADWEGGRFLSWPFYAIIKGTDLYAVPWTNLILTYGWIFLVLAGFLKLILTKNCRQYWRTRPTEMMFAVSYLAWLFTYNSPYWVRGSFPRYAIPVLPFVFLALKEWLPRDRRVLWGIAIVSPVLAAFSAIGIRNVLEILRS